MGEDVPFDDEVVEIDMHDEADGLEDTEAVLDSEEDMVIDDVAVVETDPLEELVEQKVELPDTEELGDPVTVTDDVTDTEDEGDDLVVDVALAEVDGNSFEGEGDTEAVAVRLAEADIDMDALPVKVGLSVAVSVTRTEGDGEILPDSDALGVLVGRLEGDVVTETELVALHAGLTETMELLVPETLAVCVIE